MEKQKEYYVYRLVVIQTGEVIYIGKGSGKRSSSHRAIAKDKNKNHLYLYRKINKLWMNGFDFIDEIIFRTFDQQEAYDKEVEIIAEIGKENLCNISDGGDGGDFPGHTEETKKKIGDKNRGKKHTEETLQKMKEVHTGFRFTEEQRKGIVDKIWENEERLNHLRTQALRQAKQVRCIDTGEIFESKAAASKSVGVSPNSIGHAIKKNKLCKGLRFEYINEHLTEIVTEPIYNREVSDETRQKMSEAAKRDTKRCERIVEESLKQMKPVRRLDTGEIFPSITLAAASVGKSASTLCTAIKRDTRCDGVKFEYITDESPKEFTAVPIEKSKATGIQIRRCDTGEIFPSINKAAESIGRSASTLKIQMDKNRPCAGIVFEYLDSEPMIIDESVKPAKVAVRRTDTYEEFESIAEAAKSVNRSASTLRYAIENGTECAGIRWEYSIDNFNVNDFFELHPTCYA